jgi:hypothetical protein
VPKIFGGGVGSGGGLVTSVFGRVGAIAAALNDYAASLIDNDSAVSGATVADALDSLLGSNIPLETGADLTDADDTIATDVQCSLLASTLSAARILTIIPSATANRAFPLMIGTQGFNYTLRNGGPAAGDTVVIAGERLVAWVTSDGANVQITTTKLGAEPI